ncbi:hypothetical protein AVDCRST_MAG92-418 [uncultured Coleofasciculus sp.]|uniref:Uncharacterized protein n=1 Tax=uncultured Coleofasciculus sp. TaxID=1267456 RepID=A0A6J4H8P5_9CYAN|nr:hypothetical protein AVDCRST_MAG92-418 [uncultured Coleofasciculus sp.]
MVFGANGDLYLQHSLCPTQAELHSSVICEKLDQATDLTDNYWVPQL